MAKQVKSKQRVADHGEVFTAEREVNAMLDLVKQESERIDSRFLEPACGDGNFLAEILRRKLAVVKTNYRRNPADYEKYAVIAVLQAISSIHISKTSFSFVPLQDFSKKWTDAELYEKYGLTEEEIEFIESMIRPMDV